MELEDEAELPAPHGAPLVVREAGGVAALEEDPALRGPVEQAEEVQEGALPGARRADEGGELRGVELEVDAVQDLGDDLRPEGLRHAFQGDEGLSHSG